MIELLGRAPLRVRIDGAEHVLTELTADAGDFALELDGVLVTGHRYDAGDRVFVRIEGQTYVVPGATRSDAAKSRDALHAEMPGTVVRHHVAAGQRVAAGDPLVTVESMKLQLVVTADRDGRVATLPVAEGTTFERGAILVTLQPTP